METIKSFDDGKMEMLQLMSQMREEDALKFLDWIKDEALEEFRRGLTQFSEELVVKRKQLSEIAMFSRTLQPNFEGVFATENLQVPENSEEGLNFVNTCQVDAFLYDEADVEQLTDEGKIPTHFCKQCGSKNVAEIEMITHSFARDDSEYVFEALLPDLTGKMILDIGSRLGAVLFGAYIHSQAEKIVGVEMNAELCQIALQTCSQFRMNEARIKVIHAEMSTQIELLAQADVIVLNNVFDWFVPIDFQVNLWQCIRKNVKRGALLVTIPSLEKSLRILPNFGNINMSSWVQECQPFRPNRVSKSLLSDKKDEIYLYTVK